MKIREVLLVAVLSVVGGAVGGYVGPNVLGGGEPSSAATPAGTAGSFQVAVVDVPKAVQASKVGKELQALLASRQEAIKSAIQADEKALTAARQELQRQQAVLAGPAFDAKRKDFEARVNSSRQEILKQREQLEQTYRKSTEQIQGKLSGILRSLAGARGVQLVLPAQAVLAGSGTDLTADVQAALDSGMPSLQSVGASAEPTQP
jgi:Skp family chaperone for outer membrane proteins